MNKVKYKTWTKTMTSEGTGTREDAIAMIFCGCEAGERELVIAKIRELDESLTKHEQETSAAI